MGEQRGPAPEPGKAADVAEFVGLLGELRAWAGMPSYRVLAKQVGLLLQPVRAVPPSTLVDVFKSRRRRLDLDLVLAIVRALGLDESGTAQWREACIRVHRPSRTLDPVGVFGQLPADLPTFTGRREELGRLFEAATQRRDGVGANTVVISAIEGMAGVGKTRLALHVAHRLVRAGHFTDIQLQVNLKGFDPELPALDPAAVLESFLRQLGVPAQQIPAARDERAAMYRDRLRDRDALVLLDNAADEDQVRDLVPAGTGCLVLITSRRSLAGLDGVTPHLLDTFSQDESLELLARIAGHERVAAEPEAAARIVDLCDHLPLAVALTAARLRSRPAWSLGALADRLEAGRLDAIRAGGRAIRPVFDLSYQALPALPQRVFRVLGHHPGPDFTPAVVAGLAGIPTDDAQHVLDQLQDANLVRQTSPDRYELHDLLRAYALDVSAEQAGAERPAALDRLARWFLHSAHGAAVAMNAPGLPELSAAGDTAPLRFGSYEAALSWLDLEHENLGAVHRAAAREQLYEVTWTLPIILDQFTNLRFHRSRSVATHRLAVDAARARGDDAVVAWNLRGAAASLCELHRVDEAERALTEALELYRTAEDRSGESAALLDLGRHCLMRGRYHESIELTRQSIEFNEVAGNRRRVMIGELNLGAAHYLLEDLTTAQAYFQRALRSARACGERRGEGLTLGNLGEVGLRLGQVDSAHTYYLEQRRVAEEIGALDLRGRAIAGLGATLRAMGRPDDARAYWQEAHAVFTEIGSPEADSVQELMRDSEADDEDGPRSTT
ncbi:ATP-binding protein [Kitasatospora sp. NPDC058965]|uniref:ATP-binding protein n=1 Tax=Kitasatospora sp. NPDC058965 TaxID=3346682 RepID=UPI0036A01D2C